jgi:UDP-glucuronate 4-epimerase
MLRDFTYIDDVVDAIVKIIDLNFTQENSKECYRILNIGNNRPTQLLDFIKIIEKNLEKTSKKIFQPLQPGDVTETYANIDCINKYIEFIPNIGIHEGIQKFVEWYSDYYKS